MKHIDLIYFDVTSGHRSCARAIQTALRKKAPSIDARMVNLVDILAGDPRLQRLAQNGIDAFNWGMRRELALFQSEQIGFFQLLQRILPRSAQAAVGQFWRDRPADVVASVTPICNGFLERSLHTARPKTPYVIIPQDFTEGKSRYWFEPGIDAHYLNPTPQLTEQARKAGIAASRITPIGGMPIDPVFYERQHQDRDGAIAQLGFDPAKPIVLVTFGGQGSVQVERCARALQRLGSEINVIFLCGHYVEVRERLERMRTPYGKRVLGFTPEPPAAWYELADVIVGKPGSMTITESLVKRKPLVAVRSETLAIVQRGNEEWLERAGVGRVVEIDDVPSAVRDVLRCPEMRANIDRHWHHGMDEIATHLLRWAGQPETSSPIHHDAC